jgi:hypothetical protein
MAIAALGKCSRTHCKASILYQRGMENSLDEAYRTLIAHRNEARTALDPAEDALVKECARAHGGMAYADGHRSGNGALQLTELEEARADYANAYRFLARTQVANRKQ